MPLSYHGSITRCLSHPSSPVHPLSKRTREPLNIPSEVPSHDDRQRQDERHADKGPQPLGRLCTPRVAGLEGHGREERRGESAGQEDHGDDGDGVHGGAVLGHVEGHLQVRRAILLRDHVEHLAYSQLAMFPPQDTRAPAYKVHSRLLS